MGKRKIFVNATVSLVAFFALLLGAVSRGGSNVFFARGDYEPYSIVLNTTKNKIATGAVNTAGYSGSGVATTELGNAVAFDYSGLINPTSNWQTIIAGGYITNTQPITGMTGMTLTKNSSAADFKIYWSNTTTFTEDKSVLFDTSSAMTVSTNFNGYLPNYIKIYANVNSAIKDGVIEFSCSNNYRSLSLSTNSSTMGSTTGAGLYAVGQSVTINATAHTGYSFVGWYNGETLISTDASYTFNMPFENTAYVAHFAPNSYDLTLTSNDIYKGTVSGSGTYAYGAEVTATATEIAGHEFIGWYQGSTLKSTELIYTFTMPYNALSLEARFVTQYNVELYSISDPSMGTVSGGGAHGYTTSVTITATPTTGNWFVAWYDDSFNIVSENPSYTFIMPEYDTTYYAEFTATKPIIKGDTYQIGTYPQSKVTDATLLSTLNAASGTLPTSENSQKWTDYGYYISGSVSSYMWYIDITNEADEYRGVYFTRYRPFITTFPSSTNYTYQRDNGYTTSSVYWFKYEPITWRVLDVQSSSAFLMADLVLDSQDYHYSTSDRTIGGSTVYPNNYKE